MNATETSREITALAESVEANAYLDMFAAAPEAQAAQLGIKTTWIDATPVITVRHSDLILLNRVLQLGLIDSVSEALIDALVAYMKQAAGSNFAVQISPLADVSELSRWLEVRGIKPTNRWMKVFRDAAPPQVQPTNFRIERIDSTGTLAFLQTFSAAYGLPAHLRPWMGLLVDRSGWSHYLAFEGGQPVGAGALYVRGEVGWLGFGGTIPAFRRRGIQRAIIARRLQDGIDAGCRWFITETDDHHPERPNQSFLNLLNAGFRLAYSRPNYEYHPQR